VAIASVGGATYLAYVSLIYPLILQAQWHVFAFAIIIKPSALLWFRIFALLRDTTLPLALLHNLTYFWYFIFGAAVTAAATILLRLAAELFHRVLWP
jgi:hypothetical protein